MKTKLYIGSITFLFLFTSTFVWIYHRQNEATPRLADETVQEKRAIWKKEFVDTSPPEENIAFGKLSPADQEQLITHYARMEHMTGEEISKAIDQTLLQTNELQRSAGETVRKSLESVAEWDANRPQREAEAEQRRLETETFEKDREKWRHDMRDRLKQLDLLFRTSHLDLEAIDDKSRSESLSSSAVPELSSPAPNEVSVSPAGAPSSTPYDPIKSLTEAQAQLTKWRSELNEDYFDVVVLKYLSPEDFDVFYPTEAARQSLTRRTDEMRQVVTTRIRTLLSDIPNTTKAQKRKMAREMVTQNFDKDFADAVISELEKETE